MTAIISFYIQGFLTSVVGRFRVPMGFKILNRNQPMLTVYNSSFSPVYPKIRANPPAVQKMKMGTLGSDGSHGIDHP